MRRCSMRKEKHHLQKLAISAMLLEMWVPSFIDTWYFCLKSNFSSVYTFSIPMTVCSADWKVSLVSVPCCITITVYFSGHWRLQLVKFTCTGCIENHICMHYSIMHLLHVTVFTLKVMVTLAVSCSRDTLDLTSVAGKGAGKRRILWNNYN